MPRLPRLKGVFGKKKAKTEAPTAEETEAILRRQLEEMARERLSGYIATGIPRGYKIVKRYPLEDPWSHAVIVENPETKDRRYIVDEIPLSREEKELYDKLMDILYWELEPPPPGVDYQEHFQQEAKRVISRYQLRLGLLPGVSWAKILYYIIRDTIGFGVIDPLFKDPYVEDISCDGLNRPIFVWHREFESIPTNIVFTDEETLDSMILRLAHKAGKHVSVAFPIVDAILPGGHRLAATYKREVSVGGSSFTIRKFRDNPLTVPEMIKGGTISAELAAYLWLAMEFKMTGLIMGVTGSGKTTTLNGLATMFRPTIKVVTIEDTPELRIPLENWVQLVSRPSYGLGPEKIGEISLYDLIRVSLRYRPDIIIVGEVRGEEAYVLFQAIATGHGGLTTLHAESIDAAVKRLTSPPMNIPQSYIPLMNFALVIKRVRLYQPDGTYKIVRRVTDVWEIRDYGDYPRVAKWNAATREHELYLDNSIILKSIAEEAGKSMDWIYEEINRRAAVLQWTTIEKIFDYRRFARIIHQYYASPDKVYRQATGRIRGITTPKPYP